MAALTAGPGPHFPLWEVTIWEVTIRAVSLRQKWSQVGRLPRVGRCS